MKEKAINKPKLIIISAIIIFVVALLVVTLILIFKEKPNSPPEMQRFYPSLQASKVGQSFEDLGTVNRTLAPVSNEGLEVYPSYGQTLTKQSGQTDDDFTALKQAILDENDYLVAGKTYDSMDQNGYLYLNGEPALDKNNQHRKLYKHTAASGMYYGDVPDTEPAISRKINITPRSYTGNYITGLYAPAGEVIKVEISAQDLTNVEELNIYIGQVLANSKANNIWLARDFNRMPNILNTIIITQPTTYIGSYLGGPIYIGAPINNNYNFSVTITGGVEYSHYILGQTTKEDYDRLSKSKVPYFDMEIFDDAIRFSAPKECSEGLTYEDVEKAAIMWDKICLVSNRVPSGSASSLGITFLFDPFIAAGAACAFVGRNTVNCPPSWFAGAMYYDQFTQTGAWGVIHEYNHHYQRYGISPGDEVTNNAISLVEYSLFTNISAARSTDDSTLGNDWNKYTDPSRSLRETLELSATGEKIGSLSLYADILHSFGQDLFIKSTAQKGGKGGIYVWYEAVSEVVGYDMTYYFNEVLNQEIIDDVSEPFTSKNLPVFVPVASVYQMGRSITYNNQKQYIKTVRPYEIYRTEPYTFNLKESIIIPDGFSVNIKNVTNPKYGTLTNNGNGSYTYSFGEGNTSGEFYATLEITKTDGEFEVEDVDLVLCFNEKINQNITRTTYKFDSIYHFNNLDEAINKDYKGYTSKTQTTQTNTQVLAPDLHTITQIEGKVRIVSSGEYMFVLGARRYANLELSLDGVNYQRVVNIVDDNINTWEKAIENNHYKTYKLNTGDFVYFRSSVMANVHNAYINIGMSKIVNGKYNVQTISSNVLYDKDANFKSFESDYFYNRNYTTSYTKIPTYTPKVLDTNFEPWDETTTLDNMFDDDKTNYMHNKQNDFISSTNPFYLTVDLQTQITANSLTLVGRSSNPQTPVSYQFYAGLKEDKLELIASAKDGRIVGSKDAVLNFKSTTFRYYKIVVTKTSSGRYICLSDLVFKDTFSGKQYSYSDPIFEYYGDWEYKYVHSTFGNVIYTNNGRLEFEFTGTKFIIFSNGKLKEVEFEISIDGSEFKTVKHSPENDGIYASYLSQLLEEKQHKVVIKISKNFNIDNIAIN